MNVNRDRLWRHFEVIKRFSSSEEGQTRFSYSAEDKKTREYLLELMNDLGLTISIDCVGNIRAKYNPNLLDTPSVMTGSHIDTVRNGGLYDGLLGVLSALEVIQTLKENSVKLANPVELVIFAEEEGSNFNCTMLGSKVLAGKLKVEDLKSLQNDKGQSAFDVIEAAGYMKDECQLFDSNEVTALIEYHIEQGGVLETEGKSVGVVQAIAGMKTKQVTITGASNHAGTTPMKLRVDPLIPASRIIFELSEIPKAMGLETAVVTVGKLYVSPNASNVIPKQVTFTVDIRDVTEEGIQIIENELERLLQEYSKVSGLTVDCIEVAKSNVVRLSTELKDIIEKSAIARGSNYMNINSGAVHDCAMLANLTRIGMIFVPSIGGISHSPEEDTNLNDIINGANLLLDSVIALVGQADTNR